MKSISAYRAARRAAHHSRAVLIAQALDTRDRLAPDRLWSDAVDGAIGHVSKGARQAAVAARTNPGKAVIAVALLAGWFARRPLAIFFTTALDALHPATDDVVRVIAAEEQCDEDHGAVSKCSSDGIIVADEADDEAPFITTQNAAANEDE